MEQLSGCRIPGCQCNGRVEYMEWGSEDMTETDDSEYEGSIDRANRLDVESYNYDLSEGMTPRTYNPPLRRNRRRRYEVRVKSEVDVEESITVTSDRVFQTDEESAKLEPTVQPRTVADDDIPNLRDKLVDHEQGSHTGSDKDISSNQDSNVFDRPFTESAMAWDSTIDDGFLADKESPNFEHMVQPRTVADNVNRTVRNRNNTRGRWSGPEVKMTLAVMKILICSTNRSRNRRRQEPVLKQTASV